MAGLPKINTGAVQRVPGFTNGRRELLVRSLKDIQAERNALKEMCEGRGPIGTRLILDELKRLDETELEVMGELRTVEPGLLPRTHEQAIQQTRDFRPSQGRRADGVQTLSAARVDLETRARLGLAMPPDVLEVVQSDLTNAQRWAADHPTTGESSEPWQPKGPRR